MSNNTLARLTDELEALRNKRANELRRRIDELMKLRKRIDIELSLLADEVENVDVPATHRKRPRNVIPECGTETGYQRHHRRGEKCAECKDAHAAHERLKAARRRLTRMVGGAA